MMGCRNIPLWTIHSILGRGRKPERCPEVLLAVQVPHSPQGMSQLLFASWSCQQQSVSSWGHQWNQHRRIHTHTPSGASFHEFPGLENGSRAVFGEPYHKGFSLGAAKRVDVLLSPACWRLALQYLICSWQSCIWCPQPGVCDPSPPGIHQQFPWDIPFFSCLLWVHPCLSFCWL